MGGRTQFQKLPLKRQLWMYYKKQPWLKNQRVMVNMLIIIQNLIDLIKKIFIILSLVYSDLFIFWEPYTAQLRNTYKISKIRIFPRISIRIIGYRVKNA